MAALCGSETPTCEKTYIVKPEQSKPLGEAPPHRYGTPRYCIAIPTTPPYCEGGAPVGASPPPLDVGAATRASAAALIRACLRRSSASSSAICSLIEL